MQLKWYTKVLVIILVVGPVIVGGSVVFTSRPGFCNSCHVMEPYYDSWKRSGHNNVNCLDCHLKPGFAAYVEGKLNGMVQVIDCLTGRFDTPLSSTVNDSSCLRDGCHSTGELVSGTTDYKGVKFKHKGHIGEVVDGIKVSCGTCHSHFEGDEHFSVNSEACFTCHFLKDKQSGKKFVDIGCLDCHKVPDKVIERGSVKTDHVELVSYGVSCDAPCHNNQTGKDSRVAEVACLNCHSFKMEGEESVKLHRIHSSGEKVACFTCHGKVSHTGK